MQDQKGALAIYTQWNEYVEYKFWSKPLFLVINLS